MRSTPEQNSAVNLYEAWLSCWHLKMDLLVQLLKRAFYAPSPSPNKEYLWILGCITWARLLGIQKKIVITKWGEMTRGKASEPV